MEGRVINIDQPCEYLKVVSDIPFRMTEPGSGFIPEDSSVTVYVYKLYPIRSDVTKPPRHDFIGIYQDGAG